MNLIKAHSCVVMKRLDPTYKVRLGQILFVKKMNRFKTIILIVILTITSCNSPSPSDLIPATVTPQNGEAIPQLNATPLPTRPAFAPGELVDYTAQTGDTLPALALRFNTSVDEILAANPFIPR